MDQPPAVTPGLAAEARDEDWMALALEQARCAERAGEVPVGAVLVYQDQLLAAGWNQPIASHDPSGHAEIRALREAGRRLANYRLPGTTLYVTLEPCAMCTGAIIHARVERLVYAADDPRTGAVRSVFELLTSASHNHRVSYTAGVRAAESTALLQAFFRARRRKPGSARSVG